MHEILGTKNIKISVFDVGIKTILETKFPLVEESESAGRNEINSGPFHGR